MWKDAFLHNKGHSNYFVIAKDEYSFLVLIAFASQVLKVFLALRMESSRDRQQNYLFCAKAMEHMHTEHIR